MKKSPLLFFFITLAAIGIASLFGPEEKALGANVRYVYIHGAWVLAAQAALVLAGLAGFVALLARYLPLLAARESSLHRWSAALGRSGIVFWVTYLPLSLLAMQTNWNGLFLAEPRFRLAMTFAVVGVLLQIGLWLMNTSWLTSLANLIFIIVLLSIVPLKCFARVRRFCLLDLVSQFALSSGLGSPQENSVK